MSTFEKIADIIKTTTKIKQEMRCQNCNRELKEYSGKYGKFIGCPNYKIDEGCRSTYSVENVEITKD